METGKARPGSKLNFNVEPVVATDDKLLEVMKTDDQKYH